MLLKRVKFTAFVSRQDWQKEINKIMQMQLGLLYLADSKFLAHVVKPR
jgi:hypothetical protein